MAKLRERMERAGLFELPQFAAAAFCLACAERTHPVITQLASKKTRDVFGEALQAGWGALQDGGEPRRIEPFLAALKGSRDVTGDSARRTFFIKGPLAILHHGLRAMVFETPTKETEAAWGLSVHLARDFDYLLRKYCPEPSAYPLEELSLEDIENDGIEESLRILAACGSDWVNAGEQVRTDARARARHLQTAVSLIDEAGGFGSK